MPIPLGILAAAGVRPTAGGSYELIETITVGSGGAASVTFSNLNTYSSTYQHLQIRYAARGTNDSNSIFMRVRFNADEASNYSWHLLRGTGSAVQAFAGASTAFIQEADIPAGRSAANVFGAVVLDILDPYEAKNKTTRSLTGFHGADTQVQLASGNWRNTAGVTSVTLSAGAGNLAQFSRFSIYGLKAS